MKLIYWKVWQNAKRTWKAEQQILTHVYNCLKINKLMHNRFSEVIKVTHLEVQGEEEGWLCLKNGLLKLLIITNKL